MVINASSSGGVPPQEPEITEEMIEAGARAIVLGNWGDLPAASKGVFRAQARASLRAALAGRTVAPEPRVVAAELRSLMDRAFTSPDGRDLSADEYAEGYRVLHDLVIERIAELEGGAS